MRLLSFIFIVSFLFNQTAFANKKNTTTKEVMNEILQSFVNLVPYSTDEMKWKDPNAKAYIQGNLQKISEAFKDAKHMSALNLPGFRPSYEVVRDHIDATLDAFNTDRKVFSRARLKAMSQLCMSCHTQLPQSKQSESFKALSTISRNSFASDYEYAEFLYMIRDYPKAVRYYENEIESRIKKNDELRKLNKNDSAKYLDFTIEHSLRKYLTIYTKVNYAPEKAIGFLERFQDHQGFGMGLKNEIKNWIKDLKAWQKTSFKGKISNEKDLRIFIDQHLKKYETDSPEIGVDDVSLLVANGALYSFLNSYPKSSSSPEILYWLAESDKVLNQSYFFSLSDIYLRECITKYPSSDFAPKCYKSYEESIQFGYSGSSGTNIPKEELDKLEKLKALIKKN